MVRCCLRMVLAAERNDGDSRIFAVAAFEFIRIFHAEPRLSFSIRLRRRRRGRWERGCYLHMRFHSRVNEGVVKQITVRKRSSLLPHPPHVSELAGGLHVVLFQIHCERKEILKVFGCSVVCQLAFCGHINQDNLAKMRDNFNLALFLTRLLHMHAITCSSIEIENMNND